MKFRLSTLVWILTLTAVVLTAVLWVRRERAESRAFVIAEEAKRKDLEKKTIAFVEQELGRSLYFQRQLGAIPNNNSITTPFAKLVRMPRELGGMQFHGLPFTWQWKFVLPNVNDFELCWSTAGIPPNDSEDIFAISESLVNRSHIDTSARHGLAGSMSMSDPDTPLDPSKPIQMNLFFRIESSENGGRVWVNYEIGSCSEHGMFNAQIFRGNATDVSEENMLWLKNCFCFPGDYAISGFSVDHGSIKIPLLDKPFSFDAPLLLLRARGLKEVEPGKWESATGPCPGLQIWVRKRQNTQSK